MICNANNKNGEKAKLLAVIAALVVVVCAVAVVIPSETVAVPVTPDNDEAPFGTTTGLAYADGVYTVTSDVTINLNDPGMNLGTEAQPLDIRFDLTSGSIKFTNTGEGATAKTVYIHYTTAGSNDGSTAAKSVFYGTNGSDTDDLTVGDNVTLDLTIGTDSGITTDNNKNIHILTDVDVALEDGSKIVLHQDAAVSGTSTFRGSIDAQSGSAIVFDQANGLNNTVLNMDGATLDIVDPNYMSINPATGSSITGSKITSNSTVGDNGYLNVAQDITIADSTIDLGAANVLVTEGATLTATGTTSISAGEFQKVDSEAPSDAAIIKGGVLNGTFTEDYTLDGVTFGDNAAISEGTTVTLKTSASGTVQSSGTVAVGPASGGEVTVSGLTIVGGTFTAGEGVTSIPFLDDVDYISSGTNYSAYKFSTANGIVVTIAIPEVVYTGSPLQGMPVAVVALNYSINGEVQDVQNGQWSAYPGYNYIYDNQANAEANNRDFGTILNAGDNYWVSVGMSVSAPGTDIGAIPVEIVVPFTIQQQTLEGNFTIAGPDGYDDPIENQIWLGEDVPVEPEYGTDFKLYRNNVEVTDLVYGQDFTFTFEDNTIVTDNAKIILNWSGNYKSTAPVEGTFAITQGIDRIEITLKDPEQKVYVGQEFKTDIFDIKGFYENGDPVEGISMSDVTLTTVNGQAVTAYEYYDAESVELVFTYNEQKDLTATVTVTVVGISDVTAEDISNDTTYDKEYKVTETFNPQGMKVTVTYNDGAVLVLQNSDGEGFAIDGSYAAEGQTKITSGMSTEVVITPEEFNTFVGDKVEVEVTYFGESDIIYVTVDGYGIVYHDFDGTVIGGQAGEYNELKGVFNYTWESEQAFGGWQVEQTDAVYQPGDVIGLGDNAAMWGDDKILNLYATAGTGGQVTPGPGGDGETATSVDAYVTSIDGGIRVLINGNGVVPTGQIIVTYNYSYMDENLGITMYRQVTMPAVDIQSNGTNTVTLDIILDTEEVPNYLNITSIGIEYVSGDLGDESDFIMYTPVAAPIEP